MKLGSRRIQLESVNQLSAGVKNRLPAACPAVKIPEIMIGLYDRDIAVKTCYVLKTLSPETSIVSCQSPNLGVFE